jgi:GNAT superfamily N-acetyltransferase
LFIDKLLNEKNKIRLMKLFHPYSCNVFIIKSIDEFMIIEPKIKCEFVPITLDNFYRVRDFREEDRISQYKDKLAYGEIGYFAEHDGRMIGSIWATVNKTEVPRVVQTFQKVLYNEALAHDIVVSEKFRGMRIGPYIESKLFALLFKDYGISRIITDVNIKNHAQMQLLKKLGLKVDHKMLYVSVLGKVVLRRVLRK